MADPGGDRAAGARPFAMRVTQLAFLACLPLAVPAANAEGDPVRGERIFAAANCETCHTDHDNDGALLAGGRAMKTPFGVFHTPNITPDPETGIGDWSDEDFHAALKHGRAPDGSRYYPVFPYTSYAAMRDEDVRDLKAYIFTLDPVSQPNRRHDLRWPFSWRWLMIPWQWLFFDTETFEPDPEVDDAVNRGAYLSTALGHCHECHSPRGMFGTIDRKLLFAGTRDGPEGALVPNITPDPETGIGNWRESDIAWLLFTGFLPDGDTVQATMGDVVEYSTGRLPDEDRRAIAAFLKSLPPIHNRIARDSSGDAEPERSAPREFDY